MEHSFTSCRGAMLVLLLLISGTLLAQDATISGAITEPNGEPIVGATVAIEGTSIGTITDIDGNYVLSISPGTHDLVYSFVGMEKQSREITVSAGERKIINLVLSPDVLMLNEAVVIGYGTTRSSDLTGSVASVTDEDFQKGNFATPEALVSGKVAGVQITSNSGLPGGGSRIRIRGGTSLNASNDPLIVIDGVPVDNGGISGAGNALSLLNPDDIESMTVLKDASAAAIYGSRAANGVIIITTKTGTSDELKIDLNSTVGLGTIAAELDVLNGDEFRALINEKGTAAQIDLLGEASTNWQSEVFQSALISDNNLSISGGIKNLPYRLGLEYNHFEGGLKRSVFNRYGASLSMTPKLLNDDLSVTLNAKYFHVDNFFTDGGAIGGAVTFDPTQPVFSGDTAYGGYYEWLANSGNPNVLAGKNPVGLINQKEDNSDVNRFIGNIQLDYALPFFRKLHANLNLGTDISRSKGTIFIPAEAASSFVRPGVDNQYKQDKDNQLLEFYLRYDEELEGLNSTFDITGGYSYQHWETMSPAFPDIAADGDTITPAAFDFFTENTLISFFGRLNYNLAEKYLLTATLRNDGSSRFGPDNRWGLFPSVAFAWRVSEEGFLKNSETVSNLKLRLGWGRTGQQDIFDDYPYIANYSEGNASAQYAFGGIFYPVYRPDGYDAGIEWEKTTSTNIGLDWGFNNNRISGSIDLYQKDTEDLLAVVPVAAGTNFTNLLLTNVAGMRNTGLEVNVNVVALDGEDIFLEFGANGTANKNEITQLDQSGEETAGILVGGISGGIGNTIQIHQVGFPASSFYSYEQLYDENGNPTEGEYVDQDGDETITPGDDRVVGKNPAPDFFYGFYGNVEVKRWTAGFVVRGEVGNYVYNNVASNFGNLAATNGTGFLSNVVSAYNDTQFETAQFLSDYYIENASFLRMDNLSVGYNFGKITDRLGLSIAAIVQNVFVITGYSGLDPEIGGGIDNNIYPRPRIYSLNVKLNL